MSDVKLINLLQVVDEKTIQKRIKQLGEQLTKKLQGKQVVAITVLNGAVVFFADLTRELDLDLSCEFISVSSYGDKMQSSGEIKLQLDVSLNLYQKDILLIEDIVDTGLTMNYLHRLLKLRQPASITTVVFIQKTQAQKVDYHVDYVGFSFKKGFLVGYGLDCGHKYRNLPYLAEVQS